MGATRKRIGLFGGSYDPVHCGHLLVAQAACEELGLGRLFFIPAARSPFKPAQVPASEAVRLRLLRLALAGQSQYEVDEQEIRRGGISYTIQTARSYAGLFPEADLYYLVGADHVSTLPAWREAEELAKLLTFVVIPRPGRESVSLPAPFRGVELKGIPFGVASSQIRQRVKMGMTIRGLVPDAVAEAIENSGLYL
jgi:nicotinate-nucleotide adenylyltransferase